jgi:hypothetical protein
VKHRRLILIAGVTALVIGAAWWFWPDSLSFEEREMVGVWRIAGAGLGESESRLELRGDRSCRIGTRVAASGDESYLPARWSVRDNRFVIDYELSPFRRGLRRVARPFGSIFQPAYHPTLERVTADQFELVGPTSREVWTRVPAD